MLSVYQVISGNLSKAINEQGEGVLKQPLAKTMRIVKKEILTLLSTWISRAFEGRPVGLCMRHNSSVCIYIFITIV